LPTISKSVRNSDPAEIDNVGFLEVKSALNEELVNEILWEAAGKVALHEASNAASTSSTASPSPSITASSVSSSRKKSKGKGGKSSKLRNQDEEVEEISNARQTEVSEELLERIRRELLGSDVAHRAMREIFGGGASSGEHGEGASNYRGFIVETPKVLITPPGNSPQLPHADDMCTSCLFGIIHLRSNQEPTRVAEYEGKRKDYPTGITVYCDECEAGEQLSDADLRRGVHLTDEDWRCSNCCSDEHDDGKEGSATESCEKKKEHVPYDFEGKLVNSFGELLEDGAMDLCDAYAGASHASELRAGDGILGLPTLIHRGPGNPTSASDSRYMLFFTLRPTYRNLRRNGIEKTRHRYNPALQIHASCVLYNQFKRVRNIYERGGCDVGPSLGAALGPETAELAQENARLRRDKEELQGVDADNARLREENARLAALLEQRRTVEADEDGAGRVEALEEEVERLRDENGRMLAAMMMESARHRNVPRMLSDTQSDEEVGWSDTA
jgi:hypothetical protein